MIYGFLVVITFSLCLLFLYKVLRALIYVFFNKGKRILQRLRKRRKSKSSTQKEKAPSLRSETVTSQNNDESIRCRHQNAGRSPEEYRRGSAKISHQDNSTFRNNKKKGADTSRHSVLSLDWKDYYDPDERDE